MSPTDSGISYELSRTFSASPDALFDAVISAPILKLIWGFKKLMWMHVSADGPLPFTSSMGRTGALRLPTASWLETKEG
jgi:hypothetical protein